MRTLLAGVVATLLLASAQTAQASNYCGAASYRCCPTKACAPVGSYSACKVERQTCYKTVYDTVWEPVEQTCMKTVYETVCEDVPVTCYKLVTETCEREEKYTVCKPVVETSYREHKYCVMKPVWETCEKTCTYTVRKPVWETVERECRRVVMKPVIETCERECRRTVMKRVVETVNRERCYTVMKPVTECRTVRRDMGHWTMQPLRKPGLPIPKLAPTCWGVPKVCWTPGPCITMYRPKWCPNICERQVTRTRYVPQVVRENCPVQVCRYVPETIVEKVPYKTCKWVREVIVTKVPERRCKWVEETCEKKYPVRTCKWVREEKVCKVPVRTCKMVRETCVRKVPYCVTKKVAYKTTKRVSRCVAKQVPVTYTTYVCKRVPRQVCYETCRVVPSPCSPCNTGCKPKLGLSRLFNGLRLWTPRMMWSPWKRGHKCSSCGTAPCGTGCATGNCPLTHTGPIIETHETAKPVEAAPEPEKEAAPADTPVKTNDA